MEDIKLLDRAGITRDRMESFSAVAVVYAIQLYYSLIVFVSTHDWPEEDLHTRQV